mmetsp:Transcript_380/g.1198  ORF Transcript_380/g.1198 Transcript_380/m.1198 type:complete len:334 (+) Transcript_380:107-1108(+)
MAASPDLGAADSEADAAPGRDEHGEAFQDFGFLARAEGHKATGNVDFGHGNFEAALREYEAALQLLGTIAEDRSMVIGQKKWDEIVVLRSVIHLNKSACFYKLKSWQDAIREASRCLTGNVQMEKARTHPHILASARPSDIPQVDPRLVGATRTKAWLRMSECYLHLGHFGRARHAAVKAMQACGDDGARSRISQHSERIAALAQKEQRKQRARFQGFWEKLEQQGGYAKREASRRGQATSGWGGLSPAEKLQHAEALDGSGGESESDFEGFVEEASALPMLAWGAAAEAPGPAAAREEPASGLQSAWQRRQQEERLRLEAWRARRVARAAGR